MKVIVYSNDINFIDRYSKLLDNYTYEIFNDYNRLYIEAKKRNIVIIMNIEECIDDYSDFYTPFVEEFSYLMILDPTPNYEKGKNLISLGVRAYGNSMMDDVHMKDAINSVIDGNIWLYPEFINETVSRMVYEVNPNTIDHKLDILTSREKEVAKLVIKKLTYSEISNQLDITTRTVKAHTKSIYEKFEVSNRLAFLLLFNS